MVSSRIFQTTCTVLLAVTTTPVAAFAATPFQAVPQTSASSISGPITLRSRSSNHVSSTKLAATFPRGGGLAATLANAQSSPQALFNTSLITLALLTAVAKLVQRTSSGNDTGKETKPASVVSLQRRFLPVFWLLRCADWLQGPYFYEVYSSKIFNGAAASMSLVSRLFLTGFASTALFGPSVGRAADSYGRKKATLAFSIIYALGALSTKSVVLQVLLLGRVLSGIGTSLLFSAPESWLVGEAQKSGDDPNGKYLGETFGMAYAGDSIVAICAGQMAGMAAARRGPTGPFELSTGFLLLGGLLTALLWKENSAGRSGDDGSNQKPSIRDAIQVIQDDPKIMLVGAVQSLFEAAMYIFVLQWPPAIATGIGRFFKAGAAVPYGTIFSCFMACCLLGSTLFGQLAAKNVPTEDFAAGMLSVATLAMTGATAMTASAGNAVLWGLMASFFAFEATVGMYFPTIGTLRSKYVPDSHRSVIMNLFGIPLNVLVVSVFLSIQKLGVKGALSISSGALGLATICMFQLRRMVRRGEVSEATA